MKKKHIIIIVVLIILLLLLGISIYYIFLKKDNAIHVSDEEANFINANIETNCILLINPEFKNNANKLNPILSENFKKYHFPIENNVDMLKILKKYEQNDKINSIIQEYSSYCENGFATRLYNEKTATREEYSYENDT